MLIVLLHITVNFECQKIMIELWQLSFAVLHVCLTVCVFAFLHVNFVLCCIDEMNASKGGAKLLLLKFIKVSLDDMVLYSNAASRTICARLIPNRISNPYEMFIFDASFVVLLLLFLMCL